MSDLAVVCANTRVNPEVCVVRSRRVVCGSAYSSGYKHVELYDRSQLVRQFGRDPHYWAVCAQCLDLLDPADGAEVLLLFTSRAG